MKLQKPYRYPFSAGTPRDVLAQAELVSGDPVLGRGVAVVAEADPLHLLDHAKRGAIKPAAGSDPFAPERQGFFPAPVVPADPVESGGGDA